jgi:hypothetical protein
MAEAKDAEDERHTRETKKAYQFSIGLFKLV